MTADVYMQTIACVAATITLVFGTMLCALLIREMYRDLK